jgi:hypothetical protein
MIGYCPLEEIEPPVRQQQPVVKPEADSKPAVTGLEETECNYVVMAFIVGVLFLAVSDSIRA